MDLFTLVGTISINIENALTNINSVIGKVQELEGLLNGTVTATQDTSENVERATTEATTEAGKTLNQWSIMLGNLATQAANKVYDAGKGFLQTGYEFNANMELWRNQLQNMLNIDFAGADEFLNRLHQFAVDTPYSMEEVMSNAVMLLGSQKVQENTDIIDLMTMIGNMSNGDNAAFSSIAKGVMQVFAKGKLQAEEVNQQFAERGIDAYQMVADYFNYIGRGGFTNWDSSAVIDLSNDPATMATAEEFYEAMKYANFNEDGIYYGRMDSMMNTATGQAQRMQDAYQKAAGSFAGGIFETFATETIPAISSILEKFDEWATENPEALKTLAEAFSNFATTGLTSLLDGLTKLIDFWNAHQGAFKLMTAILGGLLMVTGHPAAGLAMLVASEVAGTEGLEDVYKNEDGSYRTNILFPGVTKMMNDSLSDSKDKEAGRYSYFSETARAIAESLWDMERLGLKGTDVSGFNALMTQLYKEFGKMVTEQGVEDTETGVTSLLVDLVNQMTTLDKSTENLPDSWFYDPNKEESDTHWMLNTKPDEVIGSTGGMATMTALLQQFSTMKQDVMAATKEGVAEGVGNITLTGYVTTGDVKLNDGTIVGALTPQINLKLGQVSNQSAWG